MKCGVVFKQIGVDLYVLKTQDMYWQVSEQYQKFLFMYRRLGLYIYDLNVYMSLLEKYNNS